MRQLLTEDGKADILTFGLLPFVCAEILPRGTAPSTCARVECTTG